MKTMKLYYLTTDPFNAQEAEGLASVEGIDLESAGPRDLPRLEREQAEVALDWDSLTPADRARLLKACTVQFVGVHGYNLHDSVAGFPPRLGVTYSRQLDPAFVAALARSSATVFVAWPRAARRASEEAMVGCRRFLARASGCYPSQERFRGGMGLRDDHRRCHTFHLIHAEFPLPHTSCRFACQLRSSRTPPTEAASSLILSRPVFTSHA